jgi:hypothetical protein
MQVGQRFSRQDARKPGLVKDWALASLVQHGSGQAGDPGIEVVAQKNLSSVD